jgi:hypothetical protein
MLAVVVVTVRLAAALAAAAEAVMAVPDLLLRGLMDWAAAAAVFMVLLGRVEMAL